jgi:hypothetical protein
MRNINGSHIRWEGSGTLLSGSILQSKDAIMDFAGNVTFQPTAVSGLHLLFPTMSYLPSTEEVADPVNDEVAVHVEEGHVDWSIEHRPDNSLASADE